MRTKPVAAGITHLSTQTAKEVSKLRGKSLVVTVNGQRDSVTFDPATQVGATIRRALDVAASCHNGERIEVIAINE